jgi:hypothetical protein
MSHTLDLLWQVSAGREGMRCQPAQATGLWHKMTLKWMQCEVEMTTHRAHCCAHDATYLLRINLQTVLLQSMRTAIAAVLLYMPAAATLSWTECFLLQLKMSCMRTCTLQVELNDCTCYDNSRS